MKLGVLFSGGKDSTHAMYKAMQKEHLVCLISIISENPESYMFQFSKKPMERRRRSLRTWNAR